ncbi:adenine phosphoribosyltransferase 5 [Tanacetum coccineum]|uniref:adenine phosphoribosyltransferase n=1 Tax=Tanacetum coccineum TaxID=301880 RepID=A0ABQ4ZL32_9ASTR
MSLAASNLLIIVVILAYQELELKRGFIFGPPVGMAIGAKICTTAKTKESYTGEVISESYTLEYGTDRQRMHVGAVQPGESVLIVDDLVATGGTLSAAIRLLGQGTDIHDDWMSLLMEVEGMILNKGKAACGVVLRSILGRKTGLEEDENVMLQLYNALWGGKNANDIWVIHDEDLGHEAPLAHRLAGLGRPWGQQTTATITSARLQRATFPPLSPNGAAGRNEYHRAATPTPLIQGLRS